MIIEVVLAKKEVMAPVKPDGALPNRGYDVKDPVDGFVAHFWSVRTSVDEAECNMCCKHVYQDVAGQRLLIPIMTNSKVIKESMTLVCHRPELQTAEKPTMRGKGKGKATQAGATKAGAAAPPPKKARV